MGCSCFGWSMMCSLSHQQQATPTEPPLLIPSKALTLPRPISCSKNVEEECCDHDDDARCVNLQVEGKGAALALIGDQRTERSFQAHGCRSTDMQPDYTQEPSRPRLCFERISILTDEIWLSPWLPRKAPSIQHSHPSRTNGPTLNFNRWPLS